MKMIIMDDSVINELGEYAKKLIGVGTDNPPKICLEKDTKNYYYQIETNHENTGTLIGDSVDIDEGEEGLIEAMDMDIMGHYDEFIRDAIYQIDDEEDITIYRSIVRDVRTRIPDYLDGQIDEQKLGL